MSKLNRQHSPIKQPQSTSRFLLNCITKLDNISSVSDEPGNQLCLTLNTELAGPPIPLDGNTFLLLLKDNSVYIFNSSTCEYTLYVQMSCFGWDILDTENYPVTGVTRVVRGCERIVYLSNGITNDLFINIDRPEKHKNNLGEFDCDLFNFNISLTHPIISTQILNNGGNLEFGNYQFAVQYLTRNEDELFTSPVDINYTPITYNDEGALNISTNLPDIGGRPKSNKSIKLSISNIPDDAVLVRIIVFRHITSDGVTSDAHVVGELLPYNGGTLEYTYRGFNTNNGDYLIDKNQYLVPKAIYHSSLDNVQVESRLLRYNLKESNRNYDEYQTYASKVCSKYVVSDVSKTNPDIYLLNRTLLGGEIMLPTITYVHNDGSISNALPFIGRPKRSSDEVLVDDVNNEGQQVEKWQLYDTSKKDTTPITGYVSSGDFGYYESDQLYTNPPNYCGSDYWGVDCEGNPLKDTPVRLFVAPDRSVEPHDVGDNIRPIGIWFDESTIEYPNDDVTGHYFGMVVVQQSNISAKGIGFQAQPIIDSENNNKFYLSGRYQFFLSTATTPLVNPYYNLASPEFTINGAYVNGSHVSLEGYWDRSHSVTFKDFENFFEDDLPYSDLRLRHDREFNDGYVGVAGENKIIDESFIANRRSSTFINNEEYVNTSQSNNFHYLFLGSNFVNENVTKYISVKNVINPIPNIWSISSRRISDLNINTSFNGNNFISPLNLDNVYGVFGHLDGIVPWGDDTITVQTETIPDFFVESTVNLYLRHQGTIGDFRNMQKNYEPDFFYINKTTEPYKDKSKLKTSIPELFPGYNQDYSYVQELNKYRNFGFTFDYCSECLNVFPNRIIFSPSSFDEDLSDNYRINKANDYIDVPATHGDIIKVDYKDGKLWIRCERATWLLQPNPQQLELSESTVQVGTGDFLSIPARELNVTPTGYGGQQHKLNSINCDRGLMWVDNLRKEIYLSQGQFTEVHRDLEQWFTDNITSNQFRFGYDPLHNRILMTHLDKWTLSYCFRVQGWKSWHSYIPQWYLSDKDTFYSIYNNGIYKHAFGNNFHEFYGLKFPSIMEFIISNEGNTFIPQSVQYHANVEETITGYPQDVINVTYDQMVAYNERQSTGLQDLVLDEMNNIYHVGSETHVKRINRNWKISPLKDMATSSNIWTTDITPIKQGNNQGWVDLLPVIDPNKPQVEIGKFMSKWVAIRLYFNDTTKQISLEFIDTLKLNVIR